jgi:hypothetical protein
VSLACNKDFLNPLYKESVALSGMSEGHGNLLIESLVYCDSFLLKKLDGLYRFNNYLLAHLWWRAKKEKTVVRSLRQQSRSPPVACGYS